MDRRVTIGGDELAGRMQLTLAAFHEAHRRRMERLEHGDPVRISEAMTEEREAIYSHAEAVRQHTDRMAKLAT